MTSAPTAANAFTPLRATREWRTSPTMPTRSPRKESDPSRRRNVRRSSRAWVGCSWRPSPALTTAASIHEAILCGAPAQRWRTTIASTPIASMVRTVSRRLSPFPTAELAAVNDIVSAVRRLAAVSNDRRVRVESS